MEESVSRVLPGLIFVAVALLTSQFFSSLALASPVCRVNDPRISVEYSGDCKGGLAEGRGTAKGVNSYTGDFVKGDKNGFGVYKWNNGACYEGQYKADKKEGRGIYVWANGDRFEGEFKNGEKNGKGVFVGRNGDRYEGDFGNDKRNGRGLYIYANGLRFEGEFKSDLPTEGTFIWPDGRRFEGKWLYGRQNPRGHSLTSLYRQYWLLALSIVLTGTCFLYFLHFLLKSIKEQDYRYQWKGCLLLCAAAALILLRQLFSLPRSLWIFTLYVDFVFVIAGGCLFYLGAIRLIRKKRKSDRQRGGDRGTREKYGNGVTQA